MKVLYEPVDYSAQGLEDHGARIAERLKLSPEQVRCLVPEIRNALSPVSIALHSYKRADVPIDKETFADMENSLKRLLAVAQALAETV